jgi:hypothetical protein
MEATMNSYLLTINGTDYRLRFTNQSVADLEKRLGMSLIDIMSGIGEKAFSEPIAEMLLGAMKPLQPQLKLADVYRIMDEYVDDGHTVPDMITEITEALKVSGFFKEPPQQTAAAAPPTQEKTIEDE